MEKLALSILYGQRLVTVEKDDDGKCWVTTSSPLGSSMKVSRETGETKEASKKILDRIFDKWYETDVEKDNGRLSDEEVKKLKEGEEL